MKHKIFYNKIYSLKEAKSFIKYLVDNELSFHFDDDANDIYNHKTNKKLFTIKEGNAVNNRLNECYRLKWCLKYDCPIGYELELLRNKDII